MNPRVVIFVVVVIALLTAAATLPIVDWVRWLLTWVEENRAVSWAVFIVVYIVATVFLVPGSLLTLGAGFVFGLPIGFVIVSFASVAGASCAFLVGRFFVRGWVEGKLVNMPRFNALDRAVGEKGWLIVLLTRLSPAFPFNLLNYALGITQVRFTHYVLASWLGMIPGTVLYVYFGSVALNIAELFSGNLPESDASVWLFYGGLTATLVLTVVVTRFATRALNAELSRDADG
ncbi:MAG: TVP38/TMEM64 family protein [Pseudomonadales bacterium]